jgi:hypothetical protein
MDTNALVQSISGLQQTAGTALTAAYVVSLLGLLFWCMVRRIVGER